MRVTLAGVLVLLLLSLGAIPAMAQEESPANLVVSPDGPYTTIQAALADARDGDSIEVHEGVYAGPLVVEKTVQLQAMGRAVIDGGGQGTVITLAAPGITLRGFEVRGSGSEPDRDHAGIILTAPDILVEANTLTDVLFGIFVAQADGSVLRGNNIAGKDEYDLARKGDGIRLWYSQDVIVENNRVHDSRDVVMWYSSNVLVRENLIEGGRYGIHLMYCDGAQLLNNRLLNNSVGIYTMYSIGVTLNQNDIRHHHGPSGYAVGFKDSEQVEVVGNLLVDNRAGIFMDGTPFKRGSSAIFRDNILAYNDIGVQLLTSVGGATFSKNTFWENVEQVALQGGGRLRDNTWQGNYWSDYTGYDLNGDGFGETAYNSERLFENLTDREPLLRALIYSPAAQAIEMAATSFPIFKPQPKMRDESPSTVPASLPGLPQAGSSTHKVWGMVWIGVLLLTVSSVFIVSVYYEEVREWIIQHTPERNEGSAGMTS